MKYFSKLFSVIILSLGTVLFSGMLLAGNSDLTMMIGDQISDHTITAEKTLFNKETPKIYLIAKTSNVKKDDYLRAVWIAEETNAAAPPNYQIDENTQVVDKGIDQDHEFVATFTLLKPSAGWPVGKYKVDVYKNTDLIKSINFKVK